MFKDRFFKRSYLVPIVLVAILVGSYALFDYLYIYCPWSENGQCQRVESINLSNDIDGGRLQTPLEVLGARRTDITAQIDCYTPYIAKIAGQPQNKESLQSCVQDLKGVMDRIQKKIDDKDVDILTSRADDCRAAGRAEEECVQDQTFKESSKTQNLRSERGSLLKDQKAVNDRLTLINNQKTEKQTALNQAFGQIGARYSARLTWVFLTAILMLLCVSCIVVTYFIEFDAFGEGLHRVKLGPFELENGRGAVSWFLLTLAVAAIFSWTISRIEYMSIARHLFEKTVAMAEGISYNAINFFNVATFFACVCLLAASSTLLFAGGRTDDLERLAELMKHFKIVLYVGTLLLLVGMARLEVITQWVTLFLAPEQAAAVQDFAGKSLIVQGGFFTLLLGIVYVPSTYILQERARTLAKATGKTEQDLVKEGNVFDYKALITRLAAIVAPLLSGIFGKLVIGFLNEGG